MKKLNLKRWALIGVPVIACGMVIPVGGQTVESEMRQLIRQLGSVCLRDHHYRSVVPVGPEFRQVFRTRPQLNLTNVGQYFSTHPSEVMAFRRYIQQLANTGFISGDLAESLVIAAFQSLELAPKNQALASSSILDSAPGPSTSNTVEVFDLKLEEANQPHSVPPEDSKPSQKQMDFGESLDVEQRAAIAAQELEDKLEEQKRIERNKMLARALIDEFSQGKPSPESLGRRVERVVTQFAETESKKQAETFLDNVQVSVTSSQRTDPSTRYAV